MRPPEIESLASGKPCLERDAGLPGLQYGSPGTEAFASTSSIRCCVLLRHPGHQNAAGHGAAGESVQSSSPPHGNRGPVCALGRPRYTHSASYSGPTCARHQMQLALARCLSAIPALPECDREEGRAEAGHPGNSEKELPPGSRGSRSCSLRIHPREGRDPLVAAAETDSDQARIALPAGDEDLLTIAMRAVAHELDRDRQWGCGKSFNS